MSQIILYKLNDNNTKSQKKKYWLLAICKVSSLAICCCCCVTSVMSDSVRPHRWQPTRLPHPWDSPGKSTGVGCHFLLQCMKVKSESEVAQLCPTTAYPAPPAMGFSRLEYWSRSPLPPPLDIGEADKEERKRLEFNYMFSCSPSVSHIMLCHMHVLSLQKVWKFNHRCWMYCQVFPYKE